MTGPMTARCPWPGHPLGASCSNRACQPPPLNIRHRNDPATYPKEHAMTRLSPLNYDADGHTQVPLTVDQVELVGDALGALWAAAPVRRARIESLAEETGLRLADYLEG